MLALGIAANVVVFSLVNGLFLRPFPFPEPERLVYVNETAPRWNLEVVGINYPDFHQWRQSMQLFVGLDPGFRPERVLTFALALPNATYGDPPRRPTTNKAPNRPRSGSGCSSDSRAEATRLWLNTGDFVIAKEPS